MSDFLQDLRFAVRALRKSPGFTVVALATLTLGIGANTAIFSVVDAVLLRPLPYPEPERIVAVFQTRPSQNVFQNGVSWLNYADFAARNRSFEAVAAVRAHDFTLTGRGEPALVTALTVTSNVFAVFRAKPLLGRGFEVPDDAPGAPPSSCWASGSGGSATAGIPPFWGPPCCSTTLRSPSWG